MTLPALHMVHDALRAVSPAAIKEIAEMLELHPAEVARHDVVLWFLPRRRAPLGKRPRVGVPQHFVHASRRRGAAR